MEIKNIVFDMGNVLMDYQPEKLTRHFLDKDEDVQLICKELFGGPEWPRSDEGVITDQELLAAVCSRLPKRLHTKAEEIFYHWHEYLPPIPETNKLVQKLKQAGYKLYILSNAAKSFYIYCPKQMPAYSLFDGVVVSAEEQIVKPDVKIYNLLCSRYSLIPQECLFVDDRAENVASAKRIGMRGYIFTGEISLLLENLCQNNIKF